VLGSVGALCGWAGPVAADDVIDLDWRPGEVDVEVGETFELGLYAVAVGGEAIAYSATQVIVLWDPETVAFLGIIDNSGYDWLSIGFPPDAGGDGINLDLEDGDAWLQAWGSFGGFPEATPEGALIATFEFQLINEVRETEVGIPVRIGERTRTAVLSSQIPGLDILGEVSDAYAGLPCSDSHDNDLDCDVDILDFAALQQCFTDFGGEASADCASVFDVDKDADVDIDDYLDFGLNLVGPSAGQ
jgi:hypothetical protein